MKARKKWKVLFSRNDVFVLLHHIKSILPCMQTFRFTLIELNAETKLGEPGRDNKIVVN